MVAWGAVREWSGVEWSVGQARMQRAMDGAAVPRGAFSTNLAFTSDLSIVTMRSPQGISLQPQTNNKYFSALADFYAYPSTGTSTAGSPKLAREGWSEWLRNRTRLIALAAAALPSLSLPSTRTRTTLHHASTIHSTQTSDAAKRSHEQPPKDNGKDGSGGGRSEDSSSHSDCVRLMMLCHGSAPSSRLTYPRLATCDVAFFGGPPCPASAVTVAPTPALSSGSQANGPDALTDSFAVEEQVVRQLALLQSQWKEERAARDSRIAARSAAVEARAVAEARAAAEAEEKRLAVLAEQRRQEALAIAAAEEARRQREAEEAKLREEEAKIEQQRAQLAARERDYERKFQQLNSPPVALPVAHPIGSLAASAAAAAGGSPAVAAAAVGSSPSAAAPSSASQLAYQRSFQELTGVSNTSQIATLLSLLNHDLDRAIAVFFSEDPPSMLSALEKARSIQQNAMQQQQQQQQLSSPHLPSPHHQQLQQQYHQPHAQLMGGVYPQQQQFGAVAASHPSPPAQSTQTQIQVLLPDGSPFLVSCLSSDTMWTLYERVSAPLQSRAAWANLPIAFALLTYPHTRFNEDRFNTSMAEAGLVPHGQLRIELMR